MRPACRRMLCGVWLVVAIWPAAAPGQDRSAALPEDLFRLGVRAGVQIFSYQEKEGAVESDYDSAGFAIGVNARLRFADRFRITGDYLGAFIPEEGETWRNVSTQFGVGTQHDDMTVDFHVLDLDLGYSVVKRAELEWAVVLGWHYYGQEFERSNFRLVSGGVIVGAPGLTSTEDVTGHGMKLGTVVEARVAPRFSVQGSAAGYYLYDVDVDNSSFGRIDSEGYAFRWGLAVDYVLVPRATIGVGYEGHFIHVDRATSTTAILPENMTWAHTLSVRLGVRF